MTNPHLVFHRTLVTETTVIRCKFCGSDKVVRYGTKEGVQYYWCQACKRKFAGNNALPGMRFPVEQVAAALGMFYEGLSLNAIRRQLQAQFGVLPSDSTVYEWVVRFTKQAVEPISALTIHVGGVWVADETVLEMDGKNVWFWDVIDDDTRYLVASHLSLSRTTNDAEVLMARAYRAARRSPEVVITDKLAAYLDGIERVFGAETEHVQSQGFRIQPNTNLIERFHGTLKARTKVMRGMQNIETARLIMDGWLIYYNFFRPHEALGGRTPGEAAKARYPFGDWRGVVSGRHRNQG